MSFIAALQGIDWFTLQYDLVYNAVEGSLRSLVAGIAGRLPFLLAGLIVMVLFWLLSRFVRWVFLSTSRRAKMNTQLRILIARLLVGLVIVIGVLSSLTVVIETFDLGQVIAGLGFTSFVVGFATKDILNNFLSGILILWQQPFKIGDYLFVGSNQGKVEHIGVRATMLRKDDGEGVLIPNGEMYSSPLTIRGAGKRRRMTLKFALGFEEDIARAKTIMMERVASVAGVENEPTPNVYVTDFTPEGALITIQFWINTNENKPLKVYDSAALAILDGLKAASVEVYPSKNVTCA